MAQSDNAGNQKVLVYIYDMSKGMAQALSLPLLGKQINGVWHTGVVVFGMEYFFGSDGISFCEPANTILGRPDEVQNLGNTHISYDIFMDYLYELSNDRFRPDMYNLFDHNCNTFTNEVAQFLTGKKIPAHILDLPAEVANTPLGSMMKSMTNNMAVNPSGGSKLFDPRAPGPSSSNRQPSHTTKSSSTHSKPSTDSFSPVVYSAQKPLQADGSVLFNLLTDEEKVLLKDVYKYIVIENPDYSLGKNHLKLLVQLVLNSKSNDPQVKTIACSLLQILVLREDVVQVLKHDQNHHMAHLLSELNSFTCDVIVDLLKMITNCCSTKMGLDYLTSSEEHAPLSGSSSANNGTFSYLTLTREAVVNGLLLEQCNVNDVAAAAVFNMHRIQMNDDLLIALSSALTQCLQREEILENTAYLGLQCLQKFIKGNSEICALVRMMELNYQRLSLKSSRVKTTCDRICDIFAEEIVF